MLVSLDRLLVPLNSLVSIAANNHLVNHDRAAQRTDPSAETLVRTATMRI